LTCPAGVFGRDNASVESDRLYDHRCLHSITGNVPPAENRPGTALLEAESESLQVKLDHHLFAFLLLFLCWGSGFDVVLGQSELISKFGQV
jgi:hypothetical protein